MMTFSLSSAFVALNLLLLPHLTQANSTCLTEETLQTLQTEIKFPAPNSAELCQPNSSKYKLASALLQLKSLKLKKTANPYDQGHLPEDIWSFVTTYTQEVRNLPLCKNKQMAMVKKSDPGVIYICPEFYNPTLNATFERIATLLHEVRHLDATAGHHPHEKCNQGRLKADTTGCDKSLNLGGGYAIEVEALIRLISQHPDLVSELELVQAKNSLLMLLNENFNSTSARTQHLALYVIDEANKAFILNLQDGKLHPVRFIDPIEENLVSRLTTLSAFPTQKAQSYRLNIFTPELRPLKNLGSFAESFDLLPQSEKPEVIRIFNDGPLAGIVITKNEIRSQAGTLYEEKTSLPFEALKAFDATEAGLSLQDSIYILDKNLGMHKVSTIYGRVIDVKPAENFLGDFKTLVAVPGLRLGVHLDGRVLQIDSRKLKAYSPLQNVKVKHLSSPFYWADFLFENSEQVKNPMK